jgi:hypothetical protein
MRTRPRLKRIESAEEMTPGPGPTGAAGHHDPAVAHRHVQCPFRRMASLAWSLKALAG